MSEVGIVVIGRNEGERLRRCLKSLPPHAATVVYVDSASTDQSVALARSLGLETIALDASLPLTAARARNSGFRRLLEIDPQIKFVQFVDGDCEMMAGWLDHAIQALRAQSATAVVCGRRRERCPTATIYNAWCDMEWDTPIGEVDACAGDALIRVGAFQAMEGYRSSLIAGEEPDLCARLRAAGWRIVRLDVDMTWHDAALTRFRQWWRRMVRAGHAFAEVSALHRGPLGIWKRETRSNWFWGLLLPLVALTTAWWTGGLSLLLFLGYPLLAYRIYRRRRGRGQSARAAILYAYLCVLGKFAHVIGQLRYWQNRFLARPGALIEYKETNAVSAGDPA